MKIIYIKELSNLLKDLEKKGLTVKECGFENTRKGLIKGKDFDDVIKKYRLSLRRSKLNNGYFNYSYSAFIIEHDSKKFEKL